MEAENEAFWTLEGRKEPQNASWLVHTTVQYSQLNPRHKFKFPALLAPRLTFDLCHSRKRGDAMASTVLNQELDELPERLAAVPNTELVACHRSMVQIKVRLVENGRIQLASYGILSSSSPFPKGNGIQADGGVYTVPS